MAVADRSPHNGNGALAGALVFSALVAYGWLTRRRRAAEPAPVAGAGRRRTAPGHQAARPSAIPRSGWWAILKRVWRETSTDNISIIAASVGFYALLSIFPALIALVSVYGLVADPATVETQLRSMSGFLPPEAVSLLADWLHGFVQRSSSEFGIGLIVSVALALWSARYATSTMMTALNIAYEETEKRNLIWFNVVALALTVVLILFAVVALLLVAVLPAVIGLLPVPEAWRSAIALVRWPLLAAMVLIALAALYRYAPSRTEARWRWVSWGAGAAMLLWILGSVAFSIYVGRFGGYDKTYGSLGAVVVLLLWFWLSAYAVLVGAELNAEIERQTARDTTDPPRQPMGERGARMADTVVGAG